MDNLLNLRITFYSDHYQDERQPNRNYFKNVSWSPFDRITFERVTSLKQLCGNNQISDLEKSNVEDMSKKEDGKTEKGNENKQEAWTGVKQCMHLIEEIFDDNNQNHFIWNVDGTNGEGIFKIKKITENADTQEITYPFYCIYSMRFANDIQNLRTSECIWDKTAIRENIFKKVNRKISNKDVKFKCFRSLGSEDMVIIFLANSMKDIISVGDYVSKLDIQFPHEVTKLFNNTSEDKSGSDAENNKPIKLFSTICVFSGLNDPKYSGKTDTDLIVHLNLKNNDQSDEVMNLIKEGTDYLNSTNKGVKSKQVKTPFERNAIKNCNIFLGVGAIIVYFPAGSADYTIYHEDGILSGGSTSYKYIYSIKTYFCVPQNANNKNRKNQKEYLIDMSTLADKMERLNPKESSNAQPNVQCNSVANFIFDEYNRLICSHRTIQWHRILSNQLKSVKSFTEYYSSMNLKFEECDLLNYAQSSLHLINQACSPVSEVPNHNHFYLGSFHDLIKAYYGIIGMIFNIGLNLPHIKASQHTVNYAICLNSTARIESKIFTRHDSKNRFIVFFLPYDDFWNFSENIKLLIHEVFHYIAPYNREYRAEQFIKIMCSMLISERIHMICQSALKENLMGTADMVRAWKSWIIDEFEKSKENDLIAKLKKFFPGFFLYSNPEWEILFLDDRPDVIKDTGHKKKKISESQKKVKNILYVVDNDVKECIEEFHEKAMEYISVVYAKKGGGNEKIKNVEYFIEKLNPEYIKKECMDFDILTDYISAYRSQLIDQIYFMLKKYSVATKEAFCDIWSAKISDTDIPEYIAFVLEKMAKVYPKEEIINAISAQGNTTTMLDIRATIIRFLLLIHKHLSNASGKPVEISADERAKSIKRLFSMVLRNSTEKKYIRHCIKELAKKYGEFISVNKDVVDYLCEIAFDHVDESFRIISELNPRNASEMITQASKFDLSKSICMEAIDTFSHFIGKIDPASALPDNSVHDCLFNYKRIGEDKDYKMQVSNFGELLEAIKEINCIVSSEDDQPHILWYRGVCSDAFNLLPSILRKGNLKLSIYANQANVIKRAYFSTLYASDIWNLPIEQRMACLQHYGMPTNLLDFSTDPFVALHFAINPDVEADREKVKNGSYQPVIYVFDPIKYGQAIRKMTEWNPTLNIPSSISSVNFDINHNKDEKMPFFIDDMSYDFLDKHNLEHSKEYSPNDRGDPFPMPLVIQHSNLRITAQSGTFLAFSLNAFPQRDHNSGKFDYLSLQKIQERYTRFLDETANHNEQFLFPIYIRKNYLPTFKEELKTLNVNTGKFYPEISKIFEETISAGLNDDI